MQYVPFLCYRVKGMAVDRRLSPVDAIRMGVAAVLQDPRILATTVPLLFWQAVTVTTTGGSLGLRSFVPSRDLPEALVLHPLIAATVALLVAWRSSEATVSLSRITLRLTERWTPLLAAAGLTLILQMVPRALPDSALVPLGTVVWIVFAYVQIRITFVIQGIVVEGLSLGKSLSESWRTTDGNLVRLVVLRGLIAIPMFLWFLIDEDPHHRLRDATVVLLTTLWLPFVHAIETSAFLQLAGSVREPPRSVVVVGDE